MSSKDLLNNFRLDYIRGKDNLSYTGDELEETTINHPVLYLEAYDKYSELHKIVSLLEVELDKMKSLHYKSYNEKYSIKLSTTDINKYIESEDDVVRLKTSIAEFKEIKMKFEGLKDSYSNRGFMIGHITRQRATQVDKGIL